MSISAYTPLYLIDVTAEDVVVDDDTAEDVFDEDVTDTEEELKLTFGHNKS